jgi:hypothetical protein
MATIAAGSRAQPVVPALGFPPSEKKYAFPIENEESIILELNKIGIVDIREHDLLHPSQQVALTCFSAFVEDLSYVDDGVIRSIKEDCIQRLDYIVSEGRKAFGIAEYIITLLNGRKCTTTLCPSSSASMRCECDSLVGSTQPLSYDSISYH